MAVGCLAGLLVAGCGESQRDDDRTQIEAVMGQLRHAQDSGDAELACREVYVIQEAGRPEGGEAGREAEREGGESGERECREAFERAVEQRRRDLSTLRTRVSRIAVAGDEATATLHTTARRTDGSSLDRQVPY